MRRIELGYGTSITGELAGTVALVVYALGAGGAALVAAYAASRTVAGMAVAAGSLAVATMSLLRLTVPDMPRFAGHGAVHVVRDVTSGLAEFLRMAPPGGVAILAFAQTLLRGALVVLIAVLAVHVLGLGGSAVGWLTAAFGAGGLAGGVVAAGAGRVTRLGRR